MSEKRSEKRLYQADWSKGQTDGDQVPGTVRRILNMDLDDVGRIRTRRAIAGSPISITNFRVGQSVYMDYTPRWKPGADGWLVMLHESGVFMQPVIGGSGAGATGQHVVIPGIVPGTDQIDTEASQLVVYGDKAFISLVLVGGDHRGIFMVSSPDVNSRFRAPLEMVGTSHEYSSSGSMSRWICSHVEMGSPELFCEPVVGYGFLDTAYESVSFAYHWATSKLPLGSAYETAKTNLLTSMGGGGVNAVGLIPVILSAEEEMDGIHGPTQAQIAANPGVLGNRSTWGELGILGRNPVIEYRVQYLYYGGQMSKLSNIITATFNDGFTITDSADEVKTYSVGFTIVVGKNIDSSIRGINVFRRIVDSGNEEVPEDDEFYLASTVWLDSETLEDADSEIGQTNIAYKPPLNTYRAGGSWRFGRGHADNDVKLNLSNPIASWIKKIVGGYTYHETSFYDREIICTGGTTHRTSGWAQLGSQHMIFIPQHYAAACSYTYSETAMEYNGDVAGSGTVRSTFNAVIMSSIHGISGSLNTAIRFGADLPSAIVSILGTPIRWIHSMSYADGIRYPYTWRFVRSHSGSPTDLVALLSVDSQPVLTYSGPPGRAATLSGAWASSRVPFVGIRDLGDEKIDSESTVVGGRDDDFILVKPLSIAVSGGRLMGIGGTQDGDPQPSRFWYSLFQNYGMVLEGNYLDYGARDDGRGVAISASRGKVLIHFSSATYVVDVSGGSDMAWRELGAFSGVGLLNRRCVVETPIGSVWCDKGGVYVFNNRGLVEISHRPDEGISVRDTYLRLIDGNHDRVRAFFKQDKKQVWISVGKSVLVWDVLSGAWHENELDEVEGPYGDFDIAGFASIAGNQKMMIVTRDPHRLYLLQETDLQYSHRFSWGMDVNFDASAPELVKKAKRFYIDIMTRSADVPRITVSVNGQGGGAIVQDLEVARVSDIIDPSVDTMVRFSASARGRNLVMSVRNAEGTRWSAAIESLGMSHKFKALK